MKGIFISERAVFLVNLNIAHIYITISEKTAAKIKTLKLHINKFLSDSILCHTGSGPDPMLPYG